MPDHVTSRRSFLSRLGFVTAAAAGTAVVPSVITPTPEPVQPSLRPKCPSCGTLMLVREVARCPNTNCVNYWKPTGVVLIGPQAVRERSGSFKRKMEELRIRLGLRPKCKFCGSNSVHYVEGSNGLMVCMNERCFAYKVTLDKNQITT